MPIRNRVKPEGLKLVIPETKVSPRDWSLPYQKRAGFRWSFAAIARIEQLHADRAAAAAAAAVTTARTTCSTSTFVSSRTSSRSTATRCSYSSSCSRVSQTSSSFVRFHLRNSAGLSSIGLPQSSSRPGITLGNNPNSGQLHQQQQQQPQQQQQHVLTPTDLIDDPISVLEGRRSSSGALLSPEVLESAGLKGSPILEDISSAGAADGDNFYLLKKDSQRRLTLVKVLQVDRVDICRQWHLLLSKDIGETCLTQAHLQILMDGLRGFIPEQSRSGLEAAIAKLKEELDYDGAKINHISMALYVFQDAVNSTLRSHSIKPHWMFALDNLVRSAVQAAISILSPELGLHLSNTAPPDAVGGAAAAVGGDHVDVDHEQNQPPEPDGASTSGVSTVNEGADGVDAAAGGVGHLHPQGVQQVPPAPHPNQQLTGHSQLHLHQLHQMREENDRLVSQLLDLQRSYQDLLRNNLQEQRLHFQALAQGLQQTGQLRQMWSPPTSAGGVSAAGPDDSANNNVEQQQQQQQGDEQLVEWLRGLNLNQEAIQRFVNEDLSYTDVSTLMSREDLGRLGLRAGPEIRVWRAVLDLRRRGGGGSDGPGPESEAGN